MTEERNVDWDVVRGASLFGVLAVNLVNQFRVSPFEVFLPPLGPTAPIDRMAERFVATVLDVKPFIIFSFLFGMGLAAQYDRARQAGRTFARTAVRRLAFLLVVGLVHIVLLWDGDVLALYAIVALCVLPFFGASTRTLLVIAAIAFFVQVLPLPYPRPFASAEAMQAHVDEARSIYRYGGFIDGVLFRVRELRAPLALVLWSIPRTVGLFLLGACAWRARIVERIGNRIPGSLLLVTVGALGLGTVGSWAMRSHVVSGPPMLILSGWNDIVLALGYLGALLVLLRAPLLSRVLRTLAPIGRMALTSYLTESLVLGFAFYGYGFALFDRVGAARALVGAAALFIVQAVFAAWWLHRYRWGPFEWVWRSFVAGARLPLRR